MQPTFNFYDSQRHDRQAHLRDQPSLLKDHINDNSAVFCIIHKAQHPVQETSLGVEPVFFTASELDVFAKDRHHLDEAIFLSNHQGINYWAIEIKEDGEANHSPHPFRNLRDFGPFLNHEIASVLAYARGMVYWHTHHQFCGKCGSPTQSTQHGHVRKCQNPECGKSHFPRTDPAVIMLVHDDDDRVLLATQEGWNNRYSVLAGFVEPGESLESAVKREVFEEVGLEVCDIHYHSSQPWPFPSSLMVGFTARVQGRGGMPVLEEKEIKHAAWYHRHDLINREDDQDFSMARKDSIARSLINDWLYP